MIIVQTFNKFSRKINNDKHLQLTLFAQFQITVANTLTIPRNKGALKYVQAKAYAQDTITYVFKVWSNFDLRGRWIYTHIWSANFILKQKVISLGKVIYLSISFLNIFIFIRKVSKNKPSINFWWLLQKIWNLNIKLLGKFRILKTNTTNSNQ